MRPPVTLRRRNAGRKVLPIGGLLVELRLQVLEVEREVEDRDVDVRLCSLGFPGGGTDERRQGSAETDRLDEGPPSGFEVDRALRRAFVLVVVDGV